MEVIDKNGSFQIAEGRLELYIYQNYVGRKLAEIIGTTVKSFGVLPYRYYKNKTSERPSEVGTWMIPAIMEFHPLSIDTNHKIKIYDESDEVPYTIMTFEPGNDICNDYIIQSLNNAQVVADSLIDGQLDNNIPYNLLSEVWVNNILMNNIDLNVPITVMELIIADLCRDKKNPERRYADVVGKNPDISPMVGYVFGNIRDICAANSVFAALSFEDQNSMIDASLNMTASGKEQNISPVEKIIYQ